LRSNISNPLNHLLRIDLVHKLMIGGHILPQGGKTSWSEVAWMDRDRFSFVEDLHRAFSGMNIYFLVEHGMRNRVQVFVIFDVVVDVNYWCLSVSMFVRFFRQGSQIGMIDVFKVLAARPTKGLAQRQRRDWRDSFSIVVHFWQIAPARKRRSRCPLEPVFGGVLKSHTQLKFMRCYSFFS